MVIKRVHRKITVVLLLLLISSSLWSQVIKLASPLPEGSEWDNALQQMANEWRDISGGQVQVRIYPGGIAGEESDMIRKMRIGQIDAGVFSSFGLKGLVPESIVMSLPGLIQTEDELDYILDNFTGRFDERFRAEGFEMLAWSKSGWAYIFGKVPLRTPDDLRRQTLAVGSTENEIITAFKTLGFKVVPMGINETMVSLQSGLANSFYAPPVVAGAFQWFAMAPYMTDYRLAPVIGGLVMTRRTWERIPQKYHTAMKASLERMARKFYVESNRLNDDALAVMTRYNLQITSLESGETRQWDEVMRSAHDTMVGPGKAVPPSLYQEISDMLTGLR